MGIINGNRGGIIPDVMVLSKGLGAGVPISAMVVKKSIADIIKPGMHASTFGGSPFVSKVSYEVFKIVEERDFLEQVKAKGKFLYDKLQGLKEEFNFINKIKGMGLMLGIELNIDAYPVFLKCLHKGLIVNSTQGNILRVMPALNVSKQTLSKGVSLLKSAFSEVRDDIIRDTGSR